MLCHRLSLGWSLGVHVAREGGQHRVSCILLARQIRLRIEEVAIPIYMHCLQRAVLAMQSEQTMAEQEAALGQLREQLTEVRASHAQLEQALAASTAESQATIEALRSSMACASSEALELAQRRCAPQLLQSPCLSCLAPPAGLSDRMGL